MAPIAIIAVMVATLTACAAPSPRPAAMAPAEMLSVDGVFELSQVYVEQPEDITSIDDRMRAFVARHARAGDDGERLRRLLRGMRDEGLLKLAYEGDETYTARETFYQRRGNCLSFTMLFVALAREAGLDARYQMVEVPPTWAGNLELVMLSNHINARVKTHREPDYLVDFNFVELKGNYPIRAVSDDYALALFYSNRGVEAMNAGRPETAFVYLQKAVGIYPGLPGPWINLGVLFSKRGLHEHAESAYLEALQHDARNPSALNNLANLHRSNGDFALADEYAARARRHQTRNPYYHFSVANAAYLDDRPKQALDSLDKAIKLKKDEHQFYFLQGLVLIELDDTQAARASFGRAQALAEPLEVKRHYASRIAALGNP
jgi:tetratricopeptide (TPR) repeat protein